MTIEQNHIPLDTGSRPQPVFGGAPRMRRRRDSFWAVIPAGGSGTRLWPLSRAQRPKFLLPLLGNRSLLQQTADRLSPLADPTRTMVVCGPSHAASIARQLPSVPEGQLIVEPAPRGSLPAIALATALIARLDPEAIVGAFAADHDVADPATLLMAVQTASLAAKQGRLVTIGIEPTRPETGYGYIERTSEIIAHSDRAVDLPSPSVAYAAAQFHEKPDLERATAYVESGRYLWNASMFIFAAGTLMENLERYQGDLFAAVNRIADAWNTPDREPVMAEVWSSLKAMNIDEGIMEPAAGDGRVAVVPADFGWSDVGDWHGLGELIEHDGLGNSVRGDFLQLETTDSVVWSETGRIVALIGLHNVVVVDTEDALLVIDRSRAQDVRKVVDELKAQSRYDLS